MKNIFKRDGIDFEKMKSMSFEEFRQSEIDKAWCRFTWWCNYINYTGYWQYMIAIWF
jgi:hypothetical protein